jgi:hypothetical protein
MNMATTYRRNPAVEASAMKEESLLFNPGNSKFCLLNETAAFLWEQLERPATAEELAAAICNRFEGVERDRAAEDVTTWLHRLDELALISTDAASH